MKLLCAQVLKDLLGEGIDVRFMNNRAILLYMSGPRQLHLIFFFLFFFSMIKLPSLLQMQSLVSCPDTGCTSLKNHTIVRNFKQPNAII